VTPNKTLYIRDDDVPTWEAAEKLAGGSVSQLVAQLLRQHVAEHSRADTEMERIEVEVRSSDPDSESNRTVAFRGRWLLTPTYPDPRGFRAGNDAGACWAVALTRKGQLAIHSWHCNGMWGPDFEVYADIEAAREDGVPDEVLAEVAGQLGIVEELDI